MSIIRKDFQNILRSIYIQYHDLLEGILHFHHTNLRRMDFYKFCLIYRITALVDNPHCIDKPNLVILLYYEEFKEYVRFMKAVDWIKWKWESANLPGTQPTYPFPWYPSAQLQSEPWFVFIQTAFCAQGLCILHGLWHARLMHASVSWHSSLLLQLTIQNPKREKLYLQLFCDNTRKFFFLQFFLYTIYIYIYTE